jgi:hypothetical protein
LICDVKGYNERHVVPAVTVDADLQLCRKWHVGACQ